MIGAQQITMITLTCDQCNYTELGPDLSTILRNTQHAWSVIIRSWPMTDDHYCSTSCLHKSPLHQRGAKSERL